MIQSYSGCTSCSLWFIKNRKSSPLGKSKIPLCGGQFSMGLPAEEVSGVPPEADQVSGKKTKY
jgi:hypothetical protein